jgi:hypothetical protein
VRVTSLCHHKGDQQNTERDGNCWAGMSSYSGHNLMLSSSQYLRKPCDDRSCVPSTGAATFALAEKTTRPESC